ncbi:MAG: hypothetical protein KGQ59_00615 [Bdellovibrionales bacterium]|nr:hypothetical protein [Bdellovibrionales bacterium]
MALIFRLLFISISLCAWTKTVLADGSALVTEDQSDSPPLSTKWGLSYLHWQEAISLVRTNDQKAFPLKANQSGWGVSYDFLFASRDPWSARLRSSVLMSFSQVAPSARDSSALSGVNYLSKDSTAFGAMLTPGIHWSRPSQSSSLSLSVPLLFRVANWKDSGTPSDPYQIQNKSRLISGVTLGMHLRESVSGANVEMGFLQSTENLFWSVGWTLSTH